MSKAQARREALEAWWARKPWPAVFLCADPGATAGGALIVSRPGGIILEEAAEIETSTRRLEEFVGRGFRLAGREDLPLVLVLEDWGRGGPRGLAQWIGLGEARGPWRREHKIQAGTFAETVRAIQVVQTKWRSRVIPETGATEAEKWRPFTPEEWKAAAQRAAQDHFLDAFVPPEDAAEAVCLGIYAARSDEAAKKLGARHLKRWGLDFDPLEPTITGKRSDG